MWPSVMAFSCSLLLCPSVMAFWYGLLVESGILLCPSGIAFWYGLLVRPSGVVAFCYGFLVERGSLIGETPQYNGQVDGMHPTGGLTPPRGLC